MATATNNVCLGRFVDASEEPCRLLQPIEGYQSLPLVTLEEAIEPLVHFCPDILRRAYIAKGSCNSSEDLTKDEAASIFLYTTEWSPRDQCLYAALNSVLRSETRDKLISPWLSYMNLLLTALFKLPSCSMTVWRGVRRDLRKEYEVGKTYTWWGFSSCTESISILKSDIFFGQDGQRTMFSIECFNGKKIRGYSSFKYEDEILLLPGSQFIVKCHLQPSKKDPDLIIIQLKQVGPPHILLEEPSKGMTSSAHTPKTKLSTKPVVHENQKLAAPSTHEKLSCEGHACTKCGKCRDWYYTGDLKTWDWISDTKNWKESDQEYWSYGDYRKLFKKRNDATCRYRYSRRYSCLCADNKHNSF